MPTRSGRVAVAMVVIGLAAFGAMASCSLDLDESRIGLEAGSDVDAGDLPDVNPIDANDGSPPPPQPEGGTCTKDDDCKTTDACLVPRCDIPRKACAFNVCRTPVCTSAACDVSATPHKCAAAKAYKFAAASFAVGAGVLGGRTFAVVYPYVFIGTSSGVLAFSAIDPAATAPAAVTVTGLGFVPNQIIASGSRVFFLGSNSGTPTTTRVQMAWLDVPADPFAKALAVKTVLPTLNRPSGNVLTLFPRANDTALLVDLTGPNFPAAKVEPPLVEPVTLTAGPIPSTAGTSPIATSGTRLVMNQINASNNGLFAFVIGAGDVPTTPGDVPAPLQGPIAGPQAFAQTADGAVLWVFGELTNAPPPPPPLTYKGVKASFVVADSAGNFDVSNTVAVEVAPYAAVPVGPQLLGAATLIDSKTALVTTAAPSNLTMLSDVQLVGKQPLGLVAGKKAQIPIGVGALSAASSNGLAYVMSADTATAATVYVYDPGCAP